jgi:pyruvate,water dikinase
MALANIVEEEFSSDAKEVKGMCACRGHVTGKVCVVMNTKEFSDFKEGNVLVTACTRPEFAPLMKKAIAIVTDEGGITSHAAIVSRELAIPCVIGTQKATSIFKNGMTVEVDADNGIVKIV